MAFMCLLLSTYKVFRVKWQFVIEGGEFLRVFSLFKKKYQVVHVFWLSHVKIFWGWGVQVSFGL